MEPQEQEIDIRNLPAGTTLEMDGRPVFLAEHTGRRTYPRLVDEAGEPLRHQRNVESSWKYDARKVKFRLAKFAPEKFLPGVATDAFQAMYMSIGTDPEIFLTDADGELLPAYKFLPDKHGRKPIYWDGFQAEFRVSSSHCLEGLTYNVQNQLVSLLAQLEKYAPGAKLSAKSVVEVPREELLHAEKEHVALGCDPSQNIYGMHSRNIPDSRKLKWRFAGGHLHFGVAKRLKRTRFFKEEVDGAIGMLDALLGVAMVSMAEEFDNPIRRRYYGQAGEFRLPPHGLEYRTLSNFWLSHPALMHLAFDIGRMAVQLGMQGMRSAVKASADEVQRCINDSDVDKARSLLLANKSLWLNVLTAIYGNRDWANSAPKNTFRALMNGPRSVKLDPSKLVDNWQLLTPDSYDGVLCWSDVC
jgi:hypothetical protein